MAVVYVPAVVLVSRFTAGYLWGSLAAIAGVISTNDYRTLKAETGEDFPGGLFTKGGLTIDFDKHMVAVDGTDVHFTQIEFKIVALLASVPTAWSAPGATEGVPSETYHCNSTNNFLRASPQV
ncbi:hypothetical protein [Caproiciproducens sp. CPB-2]|uniref:hypothetical protein n=1 Tax=Caproiciproducens sp. CPB-2 TaxID=3030017 RepID=UPI003FA49E9F